MFAPQADGEQASAPQEGSWLLQSLFISAPNPLTNTYTLGLLPQAVSQLWAGTTNMCLTQGHTGICADLGSAQLQPGLHSPVPFFKLCLQISDPIPGPWVLLLQQIQAIDHWRTW